jgi:hypothetical protein
VVLGRRLNRTSEIVGLLPIEGWRLAKFLCPLPHPFPLVRRLQAYLGFRGSCGDSGFARVSKTCHSPAEENDVISLFAFAFGYFCFTPLGFPVHPMWRA